MPAAPICPREQQEPARCYGNCHRQSSFTPPSSAPCATDRTFADRRQAGTTPSSARAGWPERLGEAIAAVVLRPLIATVPAAGARAAEHRRSNRREPRKLCGRVFWYDEIWIETICC